MAAGPRPPQTARPGDDKDAHLADDRARRAWQDVFFQAFLPRHDHDGDEVVVVVVRSRLASRAWQGLLSVFSDSRSVSGRRSSSKITPNRSRIRSSGHRFVQRRVDVDVVVGGVIPPHEADQTLTHVRLLIVHLSTH